MPHSSTSPDMNPIEKCWRRIKQALHRRKHQPTNEAEMQAAVTEEWKANTTRMDKCAYSQARALGSCTYGATWLVYT